MPETPHEIARNTIIFLRLAAAQLRSIINENGELGEPATSQFRYIADQCESEANDLAEKYAIDLSWMLQSN